jgi:hypothetical protein
MESVCVLSWMRWREGVRVAGVGGGKKGGREGREGGREGGRYAGRPRESR